MTMNENVLQQYRTEKTVVKTKTCTLTPEETNVKVDAAAATVITLPPVAECRGKYFALRQTGTTANPTITHYGDSVDWATTIGTITLNALHDRVLLFCDGECWWVLTDYFT